MRRNEITKYGYGDGIDVVRFEDDFVGVSFSATADTMPWLATLGGTSDAVAVIDDGPNGLLKITSGTADNEESSIQLNGESFKLAMGKRVRFGVKNIKADDVSDLGFFAGLAITDTSVFGSDSANAVTDYVGFMADGSKLYAVAGKDAATAWSTKVDTGIALADDTFISDLSFEFDGEGKVTWYSGSTKLAEIKDTAATKTLYPDNEALTPTVSVQTLANGGSSNLTLDYLYAEQDR
jgi:hypothetical protein